MVKILDRYLLKAFFLNYVLSLFVMISMYVVLDLSINMDEFTEDAKAPHRMIADIVNYYTYNLPFYFSQLSGVITLVAACFTLARLQRLNEVTAVLASGTSLYRLAAPVVAAGLLMNALLVLDYEFLLPEVAPKLARERDDVEGARVYEIWFVKDGENRLLSAQRFSPKRGEIGGLIVMGPLPLLSSSVELEPDLNRRVVPAALREQLAGEGIQLSHDVIVTEEKDRNGWRLSDHGRQYLVLREGDELNVYDHKTYGQIGSVITADFAKWDGDKGGWRLDVPLRDGRERRGKRIKMPRGGTVNQSLSSPLAIEDESFHPSELSPEDLLMRKKAQWLQFLSISQLNQLEERGITGPVQVAQVKHARFTLPINNMILLLLGISFFMNRLPESVLAQGAKALATCAVAFLMTYVGQQLVGSTEGFSIALPHWLPIFIFGPISVLLLDNVKT